MIIVVHGKTLSPTINSPGMRIIETHFTRSSIWNCAAALTIAQSQPPPNNKKLYRRIFTITFMKTNPLSHRADPSATPLRALAFCLVFCYAYMPSLSQEKLLKDLNRSEYFYCNEYSELTSGHGSIYFVSQGKELWRTTSMNTAQKLRSAKSISDLTMSGSLLYFVGEDAGGGKEIWKSDGTAAGTVRLKDIRPGTIGSNPRELTDVYGTLHFVANNGTSGDELWKTDGTAAGTVLVKDIVPGIQGSNPTYLCNSVGTLMFSASNGTSRDLWKSDGTAAGTVNVLAGVSHEPNSDPQLITSDLNGWIYYTARQSTTGRELWKSNGTAIGTSRVKDIKRGNVNSNINVIVYLGPHLYFNADDGINGQALWTTNGTPQGTLMVKDLAEGTGNDGIILDLKRLWGKLYFITENAGDYDLFVSDGTTAATNLFYRTDDYQAPEFTGSNGFVFFNTSAFDHYAYLSRLTVHRINSDGTGLVQVHKYEIPFSYDEQDQYSFIPEMISFNNGIVFSGRRVDTEGFKLLYSNGSPGHRNIMFDSYKPTASSDPLAFVKVNAYTYFVTIGSYGYHTTLWRTDGTGPGTIMLKQFDGSVSGMVPSGNDIFVTIDGFNYGSWQVWKSNGTVSGTVLLKAFTDQPSGGEPRSIIPNGNGGIYFYTPTSDLWKSDGTPGGTTMLMDFLDIDQLAQSGTRAFMIVRNAAGGQELWKSNGTAAGTVKVKTIRAGAGPDVESYFRYASNENVYYFIGHDGIHGWELWKTDGTNAGTSMVIDIVQGDEALQRHDIGRMALAADGRLYFNAAWATWEGTPYDVYITDGTEAGTSVVSTDKIVNNFIPYDDKMLFTFTEDGITAQLWASNGTYEGTNYVRTIDDSGHISSYTRLGDFIYFTNGANGFWRTNGTVCGTGEFDLNVTNVDPISSVGTKLIFGAYQKMYGKELYYYETSGFSDPCGTSIAAQSVDANILTSPNEQDISSAPNPFNSSFTIQVNHPKGLPAHIAVYSITGLAVEQTEITTNIAHSMGDRWPRGLYILNVTVDGKRSVQKIIKE
jgi:ELWxxDGT repeat protein